MNIALCGIGPHFIENLIEPIKSIFQEDNLIVYSRSITSAEEKAKELNISNFGSTLIRDLESRKIGMVISAIPPSDLGLEVVNCSLRNSTPVFVEKPLCISNEDLLEIQNDLKPNSILQVGYNYSNEEIFAEFCNECKVNSVENFRINFDSTVGFKVTVKWQYRSSSHNG